MTLCKYVQDQLLCTLRQQWNYFRKIMSVLGCVDPWSLNAILKSTWHCPVVQPTISTSPPPLRTTQQFFPLPHPAVSKSCTAPFVWSPQEAHTAVSRISVYTSAQHGYSCVLLGSHGVCVQVALILGFEFRKFGCHTLAVGLQSECPKLAAPTQSTTFRGIL